MEHQENRPGYGHHAAQLEENVVTLNRAVANGLDVPGHYGTSLLSKSKSVPVFECGREAMEEYYRSTRPGTDVDYGGLLQGMINFHVATEATAFVGVRGSSYSADIWTTRYHQGKGDTNYEYTSNGIIVRLDHGGLPPTHASCKRKRAATTNTKKATPKTERK
jgi:hypothetical protein